MLDPNQLRKDMSSVVQALARRGVELDTNRFHELEAQRKAVQVETENLQARRNALAKRIGQLKSRGQNADAELAESQQIPARLEVLAETLAQVQTTLGDWLMALPNTPHASVPDGKDSEDNVEVRRWLPRQSRYGSR